jgi:hypothetical protein
VGGKGIETNIKHHVNRKGVAIEIAHPRFSWFGDICRRMDLGAERRQRGRLRARRISRRLRRSARRCRGEASSRLRPPLSRLWAARSRASPLVGVAHPKTGTAQTGVVTSVTERLTAQERWMRVQMASIPVVIRHACGYGKAHGWVRLFSPEGGARKDGGDSSLLRN